MPIHIILIEKQLGKMSSRRLGTGKLFQVDVSVEILHVIHMTLKDCIVFSESKHPPIIIPICYVRERNPIRELISTVYDQHKSLVPTNRIK